MIRFHRTARVERRGLFGTKFVMLVLYDRVFLQVGGTSRRGWITRSPCDTRAEAIDAFQTMLEHYLTDRYTSVPWQDELLPELPPELLDADWTGVECSLPAEDDHEGRTGAVR
ncbi:hypothetical protein GCM10028864_56570 [Microlunatus parietis]